MNPRDELLFRVGTAVMLLLVTCILAATTLVRAPVPEELKSAAAIVTGFGVGFSSVAIAILTIDS